MSDTTVSGVLAVRAQILARSQTLNRLASPAAAPGAATAVPRTEAPATFGDTLKNIVGKVNEAQEAEDVATERYDRGETTDIVTVALMQNRASVSFEATLQVRNKLLSAYRDIMSIPLG
ncbi:MULTISPECIES: flagellar hook-basal body complex protein FliE [unclassified Sphingomonas]|jgi:flagellar hook-basal body complex protein FliE|uniref:flagellar hook-basal body complex protein FliE n=1 Tax=unclassified Sphingomonas TaxID=196159 RepID=UPI0006FBC431|nr:MULTISPECIES: flagellar hook-basal body complex protein FliE [unclassified Sphingomonas]KQM97762.1 flagellar hook-basal body protein FliE [Sphingomonas sp. Leaf226]MBB3589339.1 flagellar hook-basal body complex protein FliE [Sphingomonas sp. BK481]VXD06026.1 Flagellar hook-basal body complex protein FliE [Sphingomonas sp. T1]